MELIGMRIKRIKLAIKHLLGKDLYLRRDEKIATRFHGSRYGGWAVPEGAVKADSIVYSFGIGEDASFDLDLIRYSGCTVHGFDPTPKSLRWVETNVKESRFLLSPWALGARDGTLELWLPANPDHVSASCRPSSGMSRESFLAPCKSLASIMGEFGHEQVDILKMDIEGAEYDVLRDLAKGPVLDRIGNLLVEFHHWMPSFTLEDTREAISQLRERGLKIQWVSESGHEVLFGR